MNITGGKYNSRKVIAPDTDKVRPTLSKIRESIFNVIASEMDLCGASFLDTFSGSGIMSLEAISRGFLDVVSIEKHYQTASLIKSNFMNLGLKPNLIIKDAIKALDELTQKFDIIFIDPPYEKINLYQNSLLKIAENNLLNDGGIIIVECKADINFPDLPPKICLYKEKKYGETLIKFLKLKD